MKNKKQKTTMLALATTVLMLLPSARIAHADGCGTTPGNSKCSVTGNFCGTTAPSCFKTEYSPCEQHCVGSSDPKELCTEATVAQTVTTYSGTCSYGSCNLSSTGTVTHGLTVVVSGTGICIGG